MSAVINQLSQQTLTLAGTRQQITSAQTIAYSVLITATSTNAGNVYVGNVSVSSTNSAIVLAAGKSFQFGPIINAGAGAEKIDLSKIYWDGSSTGDKISISYSVVS